MRPQGKGRNSPSPERANEYTFSKVLKSIGVWSEHIEQTGIPDRYLGQGTWMEFKALVFTRRKGSGTYKTLKGLMRKTQKRLIPKLLASGDRVLVCCFVHTEGEKTRLMISDYERFMKTTTYHVDQQSVPWGPSLKEMLEYVRVKIEQSGFQIPERGICPATDQAFSDESDEDGGTVPDSDALYTQTVDQGYER